MTFSQGKMGILCHLYLPEVHFCIESQQSKGGGRKVLCLEMYQQREPLLVDAANKN
jgi:hypothetical protein